MGFAGIVQNYPKNQPVRTLDWLGRVAYFRDAFTKIKWGILTCRVQLAFTMDSGD
jgi:hypothetical protein